MEFLGFLLLVALLRAVCSTMTEGTAEMWALLRAQPRACAIGLLKVVVGTVLWFGSIALLGLLV
jgi:hypothetical protein